MMTHKSALGDVEKLGTVLTNPTKPFGLASEI